MRVPENAGGDFKPPVITREVPYGAPQGTTTGRYELLSNVGKPKDQRQYKRWNDVPMWYRVLDRFGLPTLMVLGLSWFIWNMSGSIIDRWDKQQKEVAAAMTKQAEATVKLVEKVDVMADDNHTVLSIVLDRVGRSTVTPPTQPAVGPTPEKKEEKK